MSDWPTPAETKGPPPGRQFPCLKCGARLDFDPAVRALHCPYCGFTQTIALLSTSPAIDHIPVASCPATDQRGMKRLDQKESKCDIGAYEYQDAPT